MSKEKVMEYLNQYKEMKSKIKNTKSRIQELEETMGIRAVGYSDMPKSKTNEIKKPTEELACDLVTLKNKYQKKLNELYNKRAEIEDIIEELDDVRHYEILFCHYIEDMTYSEVSDETGISIRNVYYMLPLALYEVGELLESKKLLS